MSSCEWGLGYHGLGRCLRRLPERVRRLARLIAIALIWIKVVIGAVEVVAESVGFLVVFLFVALGSREVLVVVLDRAHWQLVRLTGFW